ncbi:hypothetical protein [Paraflavitalea speifideaquila]|uniref:hypothetical protein n=1 Tax=Paraflavitalea speifideaquila TaxID=3076558 RepID=UPI0028E1CAB5|nr:hypothetical protein [Paraflavitalea speifideiaquila]
MSSLETGHGACQGPRIGTELGQGTLGLACCTHNTTGQGRQDGGHHAGAIVVGAATTVKMAYPNIYLIATHDLQYNGRADFIAAGIYYRHYIVRACNGIGIGWITARYAGFGNSGLSNIGKELLFFGAVSCFHGSQVLGGIGLFGKYHAHIAQVVFEEVIVYKVPITTTIGSGTFGIAYPSFFKRQELEHIVLINKAINVQS